MIADKHSKRTLEELLALSNEQIISKWSVLASLIRLNEYGESNPKDQSKGWHPSREKAIYLLNTDSAEEYIEKVRQRLSTNPVIQKELKEPETPPERFEVQRELPTRFEAFEAEDSLFEVNYQLLQQLMPDVEERVAKRKDLHSLANVIGFHGIILLQQNRSQQHLVDLQLFHYVEDGKGYKVDSMFAIQLDVSKMRIEPYHFSCKEGNCSVYHKVSGVKNQLLDVKEQERQNKLLESFLKTLILHRHSFDWLNESNKDLFAKLKRFAYFYGQEEDEDDDEIEYEEIENEEVEELEYEDPYFIEIVRIESEKDRQIEVLTSKIDELNEKERKLEEALKALEEKIRKDPEQEERLRLETFRKNINNEIPDFMPGQVKLVEAHKKVGILQTDIDWVNKHKQGFICTPRNKVKGDFRHVGFRVSRVGKVFFEGRSNRE